MNLKSRINQIERKIFITVSPFCQCESRYGKVYPRCEIVIEDNGIQTIETPIPDFCEQCGKADRKTTNNYSAYLKQ